MQVLERKFNATRGRLNGRSVLCVVALALADSRPLREQMEQRRIIHANETPVAVKQELGQYFTPATLPISWRRFSRDIAVAMLASLTPGPVSVSFPVLWRNVLP